MNYFSIDIDLVTITVKQEDRDRLQAILEDLCIGKRFYEGWIDDENPSPSPIGFALCFDRSQVYADFHNLPFYYRGRWESYHDKIVSHVRRHDVFRSWSGHASRFDPSQLPLLVALLNELARQLRPTGSTEADGQPIIFIGGTSEFGARLTRLLRESAPRNVKTLEDVRLQDLPLTDANDTAMSVFVVVDSWPPWRHLHNALLAVERREKASRVHVIFALDEERLPWLFLEEEFADYLRHEWRYVWHRLRVPVTVSVTFLWSRDVRQTSTDILRIAGFTAPREVVSAPSDSLALPRIGLQRSLTFALEETWLRPSPAASDETAPSTVFTAYHPRECVRDEWATLLAYSHTSDPEVVARVREHASKELNDAPHVASIERPVQIVKGAQVTVVPEIPGLHFNPARAFYCWEEEWQVSRFRFRTEEGEGGRSSAQGFVAFYVGPVLIAEVPVSLRIENQATAPETAEPMTAMAEPFAKVFVSYAHADSAVVDALEQAYNALGMPYLRDVRELRSGEAWRKEILSLIDEAEVFQLCWSRAASRSVEVRKEFEYAWNREDARPLVRPCRWQRRIPKPWDELKDIHFALLDLRPFEHFPRVLSTSGKKR